MGNRLETLFHEIDTDANGFITLEEWVTMMGDDVLKRELLDATGLGDDALDDYFRILSNSPEEHKREENHKRQSTAMDRKLNYNTFIEHLKDEGMTADKRSILHVISRLKELETMVSRQSEKMSRLRYAASEKKSVLRTTQSESPRLNAR